MNVMVMDLLGPSLEAHEARRPDSLGMGCLRRCDAVGGPSELLQGPP